MALKSFGKASKFRKPLGTGLTWKDDLSINNPAMPGTGSFRN
jgi:hypothetical protein